MIWRLLGTIWVLPVTLLVQGLFWLMRFDLHSVDESGAYVYLAPKWFPMGNVQAITLGSTITFREEKLITERLLRHEREHIKQWRMLGVFFLPLYILASVYAGVVYQDGYRSNIFEIKARSKE